MLVTTDQYLQRYLQQVLTQLSGASPILFIYLLSHLRWRTRWDEQCSWHSFFCRLAHGGECPKVGRGDHVLGHGTGAGALEFWHRNGQRSDNHRVCSYFWRQLNHSYFAFFSRRVVEKSEKEIQTEIQAIVRQITASVTFLPILQDACMFPFLFFWHKINSFLGGPKGTFDLLVYTDADVEIPQAWEESGPKYITNQQEVRLRSFSTKVPFSSM